MPHLTGVCNRLHRGSIGVFGILLLSLAMFFFRCDYQKPPGENCDVHIMEVAEVAGQWVCR